MNAPQELKYTHNHEWIRKEGNVGIIGITEYAQGELGDIVFVDVDCLGEEIEKGETFGTIEAVKTVADVYMPISGKVIEINEALSEAPDLINKDAYNAGWMVKIEIKDLSEYDHLLTSDQYLASIT